MTPESIVLDGATWVRIRFFRSFGPCCAEHRAPQAPIVGAEYMRAPDATTTEPAPPPTTDR